MDKNSPANAPIWLFPEAKSYLIYALGYIACNYLTHSWLPTLGLQNVANQYGIVVDTIAPYLILPFHLMLALQLFKRSLLAGILGIASLIAVAWYFFIQYDETLAFVSLGILGVGVLLGWLGSGKPKVEISLNAMFSKGALWGFVIGLILEINLKSYLNYHGINYFLVTELRWWNGVFPTICLSIGYLLGKTKRIS
jgi:hypothetical protein